MIEVQFDGLTRRCYVTFGATCGCHDRSAAHGSAVCILAAFLISDLKNQNNENRICFYLKISFVIF